MVNSLLRQILSGLHKPLPYELREMYDLCHTPDYTETLDLFIESSNQHRRTFVFLDGLDECTPDQQTQVADLIDTMVTKGIRVFLASQPHVRNLIDKIKPLESQEIHAQDEDLKAFINEQLGDRYTPQL